MPEGERFDSRPGNRVVSDNVMGAVAGCAHFAPRSPSRLPCLQCPTQCSSCSDSKTCTSCPDGYEFSADGNDCVKSA